MKLNSACVWYHDEYVRITVAHCDFTEVTECSFWKIMVDHRNSDISTVILHSINVKGIIVIGEKAIPD
jgi:hypothetical protein